jgi:hypothetical protein
MHEPSSEWPRTNLNFFFIYQILLLEVIFSINRISPSYNKKVKYIRIHIIKMLSGATRSTN